MLTYHMFTPSFIVGLDLSHCDLTSTQDTRPRPAALYIGQGDSVHWPNILTKTARKMPALPSTAARLIITYNTSLCKSTVHEQALNNLLVILTMIPVMISAVTGGKRAKRRRVKEGERNPASLMLEQFGRSEGALRSVMCLRQQDD